MIYVVILSRSGMTSQMDELRASIESHLFGLSKNLFWIAVVSPQDHLEFNDYSIRAPRIKL